VGEREGGRGKRERETWLNAEKTPKEREPKYRLRAEREREPRERER
jgi:hypothetical protein